jgi:hypothetical protein
VTDKRILIYLEHYESWSSDTVSRLIDYCSELRELKGLQLNFILELSTDPQLLIHSLGYTVLQKLYIHQLESPTVSDMYPEFLLALSSMPKFPILMPAVSRQLLKANSFMKFKRLLRSLLIEHFVDDKAAGVLCMAQGSNTVINQDETLTKTELRKLQREVGCFVDVKQRWVSNLQKFEGYLRNAPELQPRSLESIFHDFTMADVPEEASCYVELSGALLSQSDIDKVTDYFQVLVGLRLMTDSDFQRLLEDLHRLKTVRKKGTGNLCRGWVNLSVLKYLVSMVKTDFMSPDLALKSLIDPAHLSLFVASDIGALDPDLQSDVVEQLLRPSRPSSIIPIQQLEDISLVSYIILRKPKDLELNSVFTTFVHIKTGELEADEAALSEYQ